MKSGRMILLLLLALLGGTSFARAAHARPGGGHAFSGGGGGHSFGGGGGGRGFGGGGGGIHYSGGRYSGGGDDSGGGRDEGPALVFFLVALVVMALVIYSRVRAAGQTSATTWDSGQFHERPPRVPAASPERRLAALRDEDPQFSAVLFDDFVYSLYARAHRARHDAAELARLAPYLSEAARAALAGLGGPVSAVIVGSAHVLRVRRKDSYDGVRVAFEANLLDESATEYVREEWVFRRAIFARTKPWKGARTFNCPNCAAPATRYADSKCEYCGEIVEAGRFDWEVSAIDRIASESRPPALTGTVAEVGTDDPTIFDAEAQKLWAALQSDDPAVTAETFGARLALIYAELNRGWNASDAKLVRPWVSDGLFAHLEYWLEAYRSQGLRNLLEHATLENWTIARVTRDQHYDAVTVRLWASGVDYTVTAAGDRVVGGSRSRPRRYSEYWTLIRAAGRRGAPRADRGCPNCGADLADGMGGTCSHCGALVTRGDFDWVLSRIEQDESYAG